MALDSKITLTQDLSRQTADMDRALATSAELGGMQWGRVGTSESTPTPAVTNAATYIDKASGPRPGLEGSLFRLTAGGSEHIVSVVDLLQNLCNFLNVCLMPFTPSQMRTDDGQLAGAMDPTVASAVTTQPADILKVVAYDSYRREDVFRIPVHTDLGSFWTQGGLTHVAAFDADSKAPLGRGKDAALVDLSLHGKMHNDDSQLAADLALVFRSGGVPGDFVAFDGTTSDADDRGSPVALLSKMGTTGEAIEGTSLSDLNHDSDLVEYVPFVLA